MGMAEREGFEPPGPFVPTAFKTTPPLQDTRNQLKKLNIACPLVVLSENYCGARANCSVTSFNGRHRGHEEQRALDCR